MGIGNILLIIIELLFYITGFNSVDEKSVTVSAGLMSATPLNNSGNKAAR